MAHNRRVGSGRTSAGSNWIKTSRPARRSHCLYNCARSELTYLLPPVLWHLCMYSANGHQEGAMHAKDACAQLFFQLGDAHFGNVCFRGCVYAHILFHALHIKNIIDRHQQFSLFGLNCDGFARLLGVFYQRTFTLHQSPNQSVSDQRNNKRNFNTLGRRKYLLGSI